MFQKIKNRIKKSSLHQRLDSKKSKRELKRQEGIERTKRELQAPKDSKEYRHALRTLAYEQTGQNAKAFGKWLIKDIVCIFIIYVGYGNYQTTYLNLTLNAPTSAKDLIMVQQILQFKGITFGVIALLIGGIIIRNGWFKKPYKKGSLAKQMEESIKNDENPIQKNRRRKHK